MKEQLNKELSRVAGESLEKLAFIFSFSEDWKDDTFPEPAAVASISFAGPFSGKLAVKISARVLVELAVNMLGIDDEETVPPDQQYDALKEMANIICGNLLPVIAGETLVFNIDAPKIYSKDGAINNDDGREPAAATRLSLEDGQCDLFLFIDGPIPEELVLGRA